MNAFAPLTQPRLGLYAIVDSADWVERLLAAGVRTLQLRIKEGTPQHLSKEVLRSVRAAREVDAQLFINDHWQPGDRARRLWRPPGPGGPRHGRHRCTARCRACGSGMSTHSYWEVCRAHALRPSYIACGPIHATPTKQMPWWPQGPATWRTGAACCTNRWSRSPAWTACAARRRCAAALPAWRCCAASCKQAIRRMPCKSCKQRSMKRHGRHSCLHLQCLEAPMPDRFHRCGESDSVPVTSGPIASTAPTSNCASDRR